MNQVCSRRVLYVALMTVLAAVLAFSQSDLGTISGFVKDPSGSTVPNAKVTVKNQSGLERQATTNESGYYVLTSLPPGMYSISVESAGFKKFDSANNKLDPSATLAVDAQLTVGAATETVEVSATAQTLQTESASVQRDVTRQQIDSLELNGRNPIFMANLVPGTRGGNLSGLSFNFSQGPSNINGARTPESLITYDGAPAVRTRSNGTSLGSADVDSTQEIQILTADYNAEYGRSSGGQIRIITKSGTQDFHGAAYDYVRNTVFNANTWGRNNTPGQNFAAPITYNQFGYNIGGPAYIPGKFNTSKNKIFWYWGQEWVRYRYTDTSSMTVPSLAMRQGDFSELLNPKNFYYGKVVQLKDPTTGNPIPGNIIPKGQLSPNGLGILKAWPAPNLATPINGSQTWYLAARHPQNQRKDTLATDFNITDKQRLQFRRMNYAFWEYQPLDGGSGETPKYFNRPNQTNSLSHVWTISANKVNELLATVSLDDVYIPVDQANFLDRTTVGINYPYIFPQGKLIPTRIPTVNMTSFSGLSGGPYPSHSSGPIYDLSDSFTWVKGSHTLKFGFMYEKSGENDNDEINVSACPTCTNNQNGQFSFTDTRVGGTGNAAANAALGLFDTYSELGQRAYTIFRGSMVEGFAQDSWKVSQKLHLDYGLRYTRDRALSRPVGQHGGVRSDLLQSGLGSDGGSQDGPGHRRRRRQVQRHGDSRHRLAVVGSGPLPRGFQLQPELPVPRRRNNHYSDIQWGDYQPRFGLAYSITDKNVIRAGMGRFFTRLGVSDSIFLGGNPPFQPTANVSFGSADNPGGVSANAFPLTVTTQSKAFKNPEAWAWNVTYERQLRSNSMLSVGYVARRGLHLQRESDINQPTLATLAPYRDANGNLPSGLPGLLDSLRPYQGYNSIRETDNVASSMYNSLQVSWNTRFSHGLSFGLAYTLSKSMDSGSNQRDIIPNTYDASNMWGYSEFDARHVFIANYVYQLPFFKNQNNLVGKALGGWQISGITQYQTGTPCNVGVSNDYAGVGQDGSICGIGQFWNMNGTPSVVGGFAANGASDPNFWFTTTNSDGSPIYTKPATGTFVTQKGIRDVIHSPGFANWNMGLFKTFPIREKSGLQFRAEAFDVFNHPNLGGANFNPTSSSFGKVTGKTGDVRNMQLSLRLYF